MKLHLVYTLALLFSSCSLFEAIPPAVIAGQRAVYQSVLVSEESTNRLIDTYVKDSKKLITYHTSYVFQLRIQEIQDNEERKWGLTKVERIREAGVKRDQEAAKAFQGLKARADSMRAQSKKNHKISLTLVASVYNYLSTNPIEIDNIEFWIKKLDRLSDQSQ